MGTVHETRVDWLAVNQSHLVGKSIGDESLNTMQKAYWNKKMEKLKWLGIWALKLREDFIPIRKHWIFGSY